MNYLLNIEKTKIFFVYNINNVSYCFLLRKSKKKEENQNFIRI